MHALPSLTFKTMDGAEREFRLSMAFNRRLKKHGVTPETTLVEFIAPALYEALVDQQGLTLEQFENILPQDVELCISFFNQLREHCSPKENERYRPTPAKTETAIQSSGNLSSGDSGQPALADHPQSSGI